MYIRCKSGNIYTLTGIISTVISHIELNRLLIPVTGFPASNLITSLY